MSNGRTDRRGRPVMSESKTGIARASDLEGEQSMRPRRPIQANPKSLPGAGRGFGLPGSWLPDSVGGFGHRAHHV